MKKKILIVIIIFLAILCLLEMNNIYARTTHSGSVRSFLNKKYSELNSYSFGDFYIEEWLLNEDDGVMCIHDGTYDDDGNPQYQLGKRFSGNYYYYDKILLNPNGKEMGKIYYENDGGTSKNTDAYLSEVSFLSRMFYEYRTEENLNNWNLVHEYRLYCLNKMTNGFKNWFVNLGSFRYFIHVANETYSGNSYDGINHYSAEGKKLYMECKKYSNFINNLDKKYTISNKSYNNVPSAVSGKDVLDINTDTNWSIQLWTPYYPSDADYSGVTYKYAFIDSTDNSINWNDASIATAALASGSGVGYKKVNISGAANTNTNADTLVIQCSYPTYTGLALGFATGSGQERFLVSGKKNTYVSYVAYELENDPNVTISKKITSLNGTSKNTTSINVEPGDTVIFKVVVTNTGKSTNINLTDSIPTGLTLEYVGVPDGGDIQWSKDWYGLSNVNISKDKSIIRYFKCTVDNDASGTITNTAIVKPSSGYKLNKEDSSSKEASASVTVLGYNYGITKSVSKPIVECGDIITYTIKVKNNNSTKLYNLEITDALPSGIEYQSHSGPWKKEENKYTYTGTCLGKGTATLTITAKITVIPGTTDIVITNTAKITKITNRNNVELDSKSSSVTVTILGYNYELTKSVYGIYDSSGNDCGKTNAELGDEVIFRISVENTGSGELKEVAIEDVIPTGLTYKSCNTGWLKSGNSYKCGLTILTGKTMDLYITTEVTMPISNDDIEVVNRAEIKTVTNKNDVDITTVKTGEAKVTILGYNAELDKYVTKVNGSAVDTVGNDINRISMNNGDKNNNPVVVKKGDKVVYTISIKNTGSGGLCYPIVTDKMPDGLTITGISANWTKTGDTFRYEGSVASKGEVILELECEVIMSNIYLPNIENTVEYNSVKNRNDKELTSILQTKENKDYIRLDELDIAGKVWEDTNEDGYINNDEVGLEGITVILHNVTDGTQISKKTDANGNYKFDKTTEVVKGTNRDSNGNYNSSSIHNKYYLEFKYDGIEWQSSIYSGRANLGADASINSDRKYETDSNAAEVISVRKEFNESLSTITYNQSVKPEGSKGHDLSYEKEDETSNLIKDESNEWWKMSSYSFINPDNGNIENLWLSAEQLKNPSVENPKTEYLDYINLGLRNKKVDLKLTSELVSFTETINGQKLEYIINMQGNDEIYEHQLYAADYYYRYDTAYDSIEDESVRTIVKNLKGEESELNLEVVFKTTITNESKSRVDTVVNEIVQYYDENLLDFDEPMNMRIDSDNDGEFEDDYIYKFKVKGVYKDKNGNEIAVDGKGKIDKNSSYKLAVENPTGYKKVFIYDIKDSEDNLIVLKPGESIEIQTNYLVDEDADRNLKISGNTGVVSEILAYTTYYKSEYAGSVDMDSNPGNVGTDNTGNKISIEDTKYYEDDTGKSEINFYVKDPGDPGDPPDVPDVPTGKNRELTGFVWEDKEGTISGIGNGIYDGGSEKKIEGIQVELTEVVKYQDSSGKPQYAEISTGVFKTGSDGTYTINNYKPGCYIVRFTYGNDPLDENNMKYNGQDYKSTTYKAGVENIFNGSTNNNLEKLAEKSNLSDARDDEKRRLETMNYSLEMVNKKAEVLKYEGIDDPEREDLAELYMYADTVNFIARVEYVKNEIVTIEKKDSKWNTYTKDGNLGEEYDGNYYIENIDFGLIERPINEIILNKYIKEIKLETSSGEVLLDAKYIPELTGTKLTTKIDSTNSIGIENLQQLNNTESQQGFRYINVDEELLQGAQITIIYGFTVVNNSKVDYINKELYGEQGDVGNLTTQEVLEKMKEARDSYEDAAYNYKNDIYYEGKYDYGKYIGKVHYTGSLDPSKDVIATIKVDTILDYVDNSLVFSPIDNEGSWGTAMAEELIGNGYLKEDVYKFVKEDGTTINLIADINGIEYQTNTKNNLAVTIDDATLSDLSKQLYPIASGEGEASASTELMVSTFLSSENESDDMVYENIAEIIKFTTLTGRRTVSTETVGNAKVNLVGYVNSDPEGTLGESDTSIVEKIMLTPPTGADWIDTYVLTRVIIYVVASIAVITLGILFIPKFVIKIKDRKFIK